MPSRNDHTGKIQQAPIPSKDLNTLSIEERRKNRGKYKWDSEEKTFIRASEWEAKFGSDRDSGPTVFVKDFKPFKSMVTDKVIKTAKDLDYDLKSTNSRVYEGREREQKEADRYKAEQDSKLWSNVRETLNQTAHDIEHGHLEPQENSGKAETWEF